MAQPEWISGNIFIRPNGPLKKGQVVGGHPHNFDHTTIVYRGGIHVEATLPNGRVVERDFWATDGNHRHCLIRAGVAHKITALEDETDFWCVYSHRTPQGTITQDYTGWEDGYR